MLVCCGNRCNTLQLLVSLKISLELRIQLKGNQPRLEKKTLTAHIGVVFYLACWQTATACDSANFCEVRQVQAWSVLRWEKAKGKSRAARSVIFFDGGAGVPLSSRADNTLVC